MTSKDGWTKLEVARPDKEMDAAYAKQQARDIIRVTKERDDACAKIEKLRERYERLRDTSDKLMELVQRRY